MHEQIREPREIMRDEMHMRDRVLATLKDGPKTVPEIADAVGSPVHEVMYWVMAARKYGYVEESAEPTEDDYFQYLLVEKEQRGDDNG
jgi:predicted Rossmann fold nucleotide-binding protein DprA/Smf involved in DNA uptake